LKPKTPKLPYSNTPSRILPSPLYAILDTSFSKSRSPITILHEFLAGGVRLVQLRAKELSAGEFLTLAKEARQLTREAGATFIVNDRADIALAVGADGVHLGQDDLPLAAARKVLGPEQIIGISTHDLDQACSAELNGADYIGFGPIFGSTTKDTGYSPRGLQMLSEIRAAVKIPVVAIGGINESNVAEVWNTGADAAAIISDLMAAEDIGTKIKRLLTSLQ
jgi:thiamine-phosphate pyrophosphorylase